MQPDGTIPTVSIPGTGDLGEAFINSVHGFPHFLSELYSWGISFAHFVVVISFPIALFFFIGIVYVIEQLKVIKKKEAEKYDVKTEPAFETAPGEKGDDFGLRWKKLQSLINSPNQNDWKQAIIEADSMLLEMLTGLGYQGDGVGEKLQRIVTGDMKSLQDAWDAHKVRNQIAHETGFPLDHHLANQTIHMYRKAFEEFYYI